MTPGSVEVAVIGSGPGGSITSAILAEHGREVLILEDGDHRPLESCEPFSVEEMRQKYRCGGLNPALGNPAIPFVEARCVGGGSEINSGLYHRTPDEMLDFWRLRYHVREAGPADIAPHFEAAETDLSVRTTPGGVMPAASRKLADGARALGWNAVEVPRWFRYDGQTGPDGSPTGARQPMTKTYIPRALAAGAKIRAGVHVLRVERTPGAWKIHYRDASGAGVLKAETVFLCAGAIQTPAILRRGGIHRNVGNSLAMHPTVKIAALFPDRINHEALGVPVHQVKEFSPRMSFGCSISSPPYLALAMLDHPDYQDRVIHHHRNMAIYYAALTGDPVGTIRPLPFCDDPLVRYSLSQEDWKDLALAMRRLARVLLAAGARELFPSVRGMKPVCSESDLSSFPAELPPARTSLMTIHLFSSCPMGELKTRCAADSFGKVHATDGLYINDASLIPTAPGVNPQGTVMAFARRNALRFLGRTEPRAVA